MMVLVRRQAWQASLTMTAVAHRRQDFESEGNSDMYRVHPYEGLELPQSQTPKKWWIYQDTTVDLESLRFPLERAFASAGIDQRSAEGAHGSHEAGLGAANALPLPELRHTEAEVASAAPLASTSGLEQSVQQLAPIGDFASNPVSSTSVGTNSATPVLAIDADKAADRVPNSAAELKDAAEDKAKSAAADKAADAVQEPQEDEEPDEDEIVELLQATAEQ